MTYLEAIVHLPRLMDKSHTEDYVCGRDHLAELERDFGLKPLKRTASRVTYDRHEVDDAINRMRLKRDQTPCAAGP